MGIRGICLDKETNTVLLVKHTYSEGWSLPGGGVEPGESALFALEREMREEVGVKFKSANVVAVYHNASISKRDHVVIYTVEDWHRKLVYELPQLEISEAAWWELDSMPKDLTPCTTYALGELAKMLGRTL